MIYEKIPNDPQERKVIVLLEGPEVESIRLNDKTKEKEWLSDSRSEICVLKWPLMESQKEHKLISELRNENLLRNENVLLQNPYDSDKYDLLQPDKEDDLYFKNAKHKHACFIEVCRLLGAKRVKMEQKSSKNEHTDIFADMKTKLKMWEIDALGNYGLRKKLQQLFEADSTFPGHPSLKINFQEVQYYLEKNNLCSDKQLTSLIECRNPRNPLSKQKVKMSYTGETEKMLRATLGIKFPIGDGRINFNMKTIKTESVEFIYEVEFPDENANI
jgi:hypothetical protein